LEILVEELEGGLWVAAVDKGRLQGLEVDPGLEEVRWGSIYWGKVARIDKAMDCAFINLDGDNEGILNNTDLRTRDSKGKIIKGGDKAIGQVLTPGQMVIVQAKSGFLRNEAMFDFMREDKTPKLSMDITIPGRYLIHAPFLKDNQISSRVRDKKLRDQMMAMMKAFHGLHGLILRSAAADTQTDILIREAKILDDIWRRLQEHFSGDNPGLIMEGPDAFERTISDHADKVIDRLEIVTMDRYQDIEGWCEVFAPDLVPKIKPVELEDPSAQLALFDYRGLLGDIEDLFQDYALLPHAGSLIIQQTAALTAIDVNRGGDTRPSIDVNLEAALEIARQIRLRNIGGIIVIDFLKFTKRGDQQAFLKALEPIFDTDPCTVQIHGMTGLGLLEITRKRRTPPLSERLDNVQSFLTPD
jgi:ribonuclease G